MTTWYRQTRYVEDTVAPAVTSLYTLQCTCLANGVKTANVARVPDYIGFLDIGKPWESIQWLYPQTLEELLLACSLRRMGSVDDLAPPPEEHWRLPYCIKPSDHLRSLLRCSCLPGSCCQARDGATHTNELRFAYDFLLPVGTPVLAPHHAL